MGRRRILNKPLFLCLVCGDRAKGKNFGVVACPACTAFFRFSIVNEKSYKCKQRGNCQIHVSLKRRCICRFCRLQKCFRLGMDTELVQNRKIAAENLINKGENKNEIIENGIEEEMENNFEKNENVGNMQNEQRHGLLFGEDFDIGFGEMKKLMRRCRQGRDWTECFRECRLDEENGCLEDLLENKEIWARMIEWSRKTQKDNEFAKMWTKKMYLGAANLLGISPIIHSDFWLSEQLLCAEFFKKMPKYEELATEDKLKQFRFAMVPAILFSSAYYSQQEGMQHLVGNKGISPHWAYDIEMYANDTNVTNMSNEIYMDFVGKLACIQLTTQEFNLLLAMVFYQAARPDLSESARHLIQSERQKLAGNLMRLQQHKFGLDIAVCRHMDSMNLLTTAAETAIQQERLEIHVDLYYLKGKRQKPLPKAFQPRSMIDRQIEPNAFSTATKFHDKNGSVNSDWSPTAQSYEWSPSSQIPQEIGNNDQQQRPAHNHYIQIATQHHGGNFSTDNNAAAGFGHNHHNISEGHQFSSWNPPILRPFEESLPNFCHSASNYWKSQEHVITHGLNDFALLFEETNGENYFFENQSTNLEFLC